MPHPLTGLTPAQSRLRLAEPLSRPELDLIAESVLNGTGPLSVDQLLTALPTAADRAHVVNQHVSRHPLTCTRVAQHIVALDDQGHHVWVNLAQPVTPDVLDVLSVGQGSLLRRALHSYDQVPSAAVSAFCDSTVSATVATLVVTAFDRVAVRDRPSVVTAVARLLTVHGGASTFPTPEEEQLHLAAVRCTATTHPWGVDGGTFEVLTGTVYAVAAAWMLGETGEPVTAEKLLEFLPTGMSDEDQERILEEVDATWRRHPARFTDPRTPWTDAVFSRVRPHVPASLMRRVIDRRLGGERERAELATNMVDDWAGTLDELWAATESILAAA